MDASLQKVLKTTKTLIYDTASENKHQCPGFNGRLNSHTGYMVPFERQWFRILIQNSSMNLKNNDFLK